MFFQPAAVRVNAVTIVLSKFAALCAVSAIVTNAVTNRAAVGAVTTLTLTGFVLIFPIFYWGLLTAACLKGIIDADSSNVTGAAPAPRDRRRTTFSSERFAQPRYRDLPEAWRTPTSDLIQRLFQVSLPVYVVVFVLTFIVGNGQGPKSNFTAAANVFAVGTIVFTLAGSRFLIVDRQRRRSA